MKNIFRVRDNFGGVIQVMLLEGNSEVPEDLIYVRLKRRKEKEVGFIVKPCEARYIIHGLFLAIDQIIEDYKLEKFKIKSSF